LEGKLDRSVVTPEKNSKESGWDTKKKEKIHWAKNLNTTRQPAVNSSE